MAQAFGREADEDRMIGLVRAIEVLKSEADEAALIDQLESLSPDDIMRFTRMEVPGVNEGNLTVLGHLCIKKPCSERLLKSLLTRNNVNLLEEFDGHNIPLLHLAVFYGNDAAVSVLCSCEGINLCATDSANPNAVQPEVQELEWWGDKVLRGAFKSQFPTSNFKDNNKFTALHCAAWQGHSVIVAFLAQKMSSDPRGRPTLNALDKFHMSALHYAVMRGDAAMVEVLLSYSMVRGNNGQERGYETPVRMAWLLSKGKQLISDFDMDNLVPEYDAIFGLLSEHPDVKAYTENLQKDRQRFIDSASASLVVATLIISITFTGFLQPPLGFSEYYNTGNLVKGNAAPPDTYSSYAAIGNPRVRAFFMVNSWCFAFAVVSLFIGVSVFLPGLDGLEILEVNARRAHEIQRNTQFFSFLSVWSSVLFKANVAVCTGSKTLLEAEVERVRTLHRWEICFLFLAIYFLVFDFYVTKVADIPPDAHIIRDEFLILILVIAPVMLGSFFYHLLCVICFNKALLHLRKYLRK